MSHRAIAYVFILLICIALIPISLAEGISSVRIEEYAQPGTELPVQIILPMKTEWQGWITIPELGIIEHTRHIGSSRSATGYLYLPPTVPPGEYLVRVQVRKKDSNSEEDAFFRHRWIYVE